MKKQVWMSYDLGVTGDYESLYLWLDRREAKECGDGLAYFIFEEEKDAAAEIKASLQQSISVSPRTRIYVVFKGSVKKKDGIRGVFIFGHRRPAPWAGSASGETVDEEIRADLT